jgi:RHS repeat-associated protein
VYVTDTLGVNEMRYFHFDQIGSIAAVTNDAGGLLQGLAYEAFGKRRSPDGTPDPFNAILGTATDRGFTGHEHLDEIGLIHMNGRVYDPLLGRFMTADPTVQSAENLQTYNRYSYAGNNPLAFVDPTGYGWRSRISHFINSVKAFDPISNMLSALHGVMHGNLAEAMMGVNHAFSPATVWSDRYVRNHPSLAPYYTMAMTTACSVASAGVASMACAAGASAYTTGLMGGGNSDILKAGAISFATAYAMNEVGNFTGHQQPFLSAEHFENIAGHALVGCASTAAGGGSCRSGAMSGGFGSLVTPVTSSWDPVGGFVAATVVGGTASELSGGSFANGAKTAAFGYLFNQGLVPPGGLLEYADALANRFMSGEAANDIDAHGVLGVLSDMAMVAGGAAAPRAASAIYEASGPLLRACTICVGALGFSPGIDRVVINAPVRSIVIRAEEGEAIRRASDAAQRASATGR